MCRAGLLLLANSDKLIRKELLTVLSLTKKRMEAPWQTKKQVLRWMHGMAAQQKSQNQYIICLYKVVPGTSPISLEYPNPAGAISSTQLRAYTTHWPVTGMHMHSNQRMHSFTHESWARATASAHSHRAGFNSRTALSLSRSQGSSCHPAMAPRGRAGGSHYPKEAARQNCQGLTSRDRRA